MRERVALRLLVYGAFLTGVLAAYLAFWPSSWGYRDQVTAVICLVATVAFYFEAYRLIRTPRTDSEPSHTWDRVFWLGLPAILSLFWIHPLVPVFHFQILGYGLAVAYIVYGVRAVSRLSPSNSLLSTYARYYVSIIFAAVVMLFLLVVAALSTVGLLVVLVIWTGLFLAARTFAARTFAC